MRGNFADRSAIEERAKQVAHDRILSGDDPTVTTPLLRFLEVAHRLDDLVQDTHLRLESQLVLESKNEQLLQLLSGIMDAKGQSNVKKAIARARAALAPKT